MIKKLKCNKLLKISSITVGSYINTFCAENVIELNVNSYIKVNGRMTSLEGFELKKNENEIKTRKDLLKYFLDNFSDLKFNNVDDSEDVENGAIIDEVFNLKEEFTNDKLFIININGMFNESFNDDKDDKKKILADVFTNKKLCLNLKTDSEVKINYDNCCYNLNNEFKGKLEDVNNEIKSYFNVGQIKDLMQKKGFKRDKISINDGEDNEIEDSIILDKIEIHVDYKDDVNNYLEPKTAEIEFIAGNGLILDKNAKKYKIDFFKDSITEDTTIFNFITDKFKGLSDKNCKIEYFYSGDNIWKNVEEVYGFEDGDKIKITINTEVKGFTIKKNIEKNKINVNFEVKDPSKYVFKTTITNISSLEIEKGKDYNYLISKIKKHLGKELKEGFKIYKNIKDPSNEFTSGLLEDNITYIVVFDETATDFVKEKEKDRLYINLKFEVTDNTKFKLKQDVRDKDNIEIQQGKNYNYLLGIIKQHLGGRDLKEGFKIYKNDKNNEFTTGNLENNITYIVVFDETATDFVDKKEEHKNQDPQETQETTNTEQNKNYNNTKKGGCSGKKGKYSNK